MDGGRKVSMDHVSDHPMFLLLDHLLKQQVFLSCLCVQGSILILTFHDKWQVNQCYHLSQKCYIYITCMYINCCCTLAEALEAGNGDA